MIPIELSVRNFLSYGDAAVTLDFTGFHVACLTGANGHGKSALLDAITYALWGQARKERGDRKPDEGLLRLGAEEMQVSFTFEVDERRFRVLRSFRRRRRSAVTELELQAWDGDTGSYRPLSDSSAMSRTQERIDQLLAMDYDTFINSAFILQGRADEFTRKSARERKSILGEILGLSRYERLQERARQHLAEEEKRAHALQSRCTGVDAELADRDTCRQKLAEIEAALGTLAGEIAAAEGELEVLARSLVEAQARGQRRTEAEATAAALAQEGRQIEVRLQQFADAFRADDEVVSRAEEIEARYQEHGALSDEARRLADALAQVRDLELAAARLESQIGDARHRLEAQLAVQDARCSEIAAAIAEAEGLMSRRDEIGSAYRELVQARERESVLAEKAQDLHDLVQRRLHLEHEVELETRRLEERRTALEQQLGEVAALLAGASSLEAEKKRAAERLAEAEARLEALDAVKEKGSALRLQLGALETRLSQCRTERAELDGRVEVLSSSGAAACPLCGTPLDAHHRAQLGRELNLTRAGLDRDIADLETRHSDVAAALQQCRDEYRRGAGTQEAARTCSAELARVGARLDGLAAARATSSRLAREIDEVTGALAAGTCAARARAALLVLGREEAALARVPEDLERTRREMRELAEAETRWAQISDVGQRLQRSRDALGEAEAERDRLRDRLEAGAETEALRRELGETRARLEQVAYRPERHTEVRARLEALGDAPAQMAHLSEARLKRDRLEEDVARLQVEGRRVEARASEVKDLLDELSRAAANDGELHRRVDEARHSVAARRERREAMLQEAGSARARCRRLDALQEERRDLAVQLQQSEDQAWLCRQLAQAFGKDGIQALVIEGAIPEIEEEANHLLNRLTDNRIQVSIESLRDLKGGGTRETLDIQIADELGSRSYNLYSGGEAFRTDFALRIALSRVLARRAGTKLRTLIIDEGFGTQDSHGLEQLKEAIQEISGDFDKLLVVTHLPELKDAFPVQIEVTKDPQAGSQLRLVDLR